MECSEKDCLHLSPYITTLVYRYPEDNDQFYNLFGRRFGCDDFMFNICNPCFLSAITPKPPIVRCNKKRTEIYIYNGTFQYNYDLNKLREIATLCKKENGFKEDVKIYVFK